MYLFLSSGATEQYRKDILRALALPAGAELQLRYNLRWVADDIKGRLGLIPGLEDRRAILAYINHDTDNCLIVPCRKAKLVDISQCGSMVVALLKLGNFVWVKDNALAQFNTLIRRLMDKLPHRQEGTIVGAYCAFADGDEWIRADLPLSFSYSSLAVSEINVWESIVNQLSCYRDYEKEPYFCMVRGLYPEKSTIGALYDNGYYELHPGRHQLRLYCYRPEHLPTPDQLPVLGVYPATDLIDMLTDTMVMINSRYDLKCIDFVVNEPKGSVHSALMLGEDWGKNGLPRIYLNIRIKGYD